MPRDPIISKYWSRRTSGASGSPNVGSIDSPSIGCCVTPSTVAGGAMPAASSTVANTSTAWQNCGRTLPGPVTRSPQRTTSGVRTPPSHAYRFHRRNGALPAHAQPNG